MAHVLLHFVRQQFVGKRLYVDSFLAATYDRFLPQLFIIECFDLVTVVSIVLDDIDH